MMPWGPKGKKGDNGARGPMPSKLITSITDGLKTIYFQKVWGTGASWEQLWGTILGRVFVA